VAIPRSGVIPNNVKVPPLDELAARVRVLGLGEPTHGSREFGDLRFSLPRYLSNDTDLEVLAIEASASSLRQLAPYLNGETERTPASHV